MKIEIDTDRLKELELTPDQYVYLYLKFHKFPINDCIGWSILESKGYVKLTEGGIELRESAYQLFETTDEERLWIEFWSLFPMKVPNRSGGSRPLRASSLEAKDSQVCRKKYLAIIKGKPHLHDHIVKVLNAEVEMKRPIGDLQFMNAMEPWLNQRMWEKYEYLLEDKKKQAGIVGYGGKLI